MFNRTTIVFAATATAVTLAACSPISTVGNPRVPGSSQTAKSATATYTPTSVDPYSSTGTWLVPDEIKPGTYRVSLNPGASHGYGAVCGDYECDPFGEPGMLSNDNYKGPGIMVIPQSAVSVELKNITITPMQPGSR